MYVTAWIVLLPITAIQARDCKITAVTSTFPTDYTSKDSFPVIFNFVPTLVARSGSGGGRADDHRSVFD